MSALSTNPSFRDFVRPDHALLAELFSAPPMDRSAGLDLALEAVLSQARERVEYDPSPGRRDFEDLRQEVVAAAGGRVRLNCINLACVLASRLRQAGFDAGEVFVALCGHSSPIQASRSEEFHAWVLVRRQGELLSIDPALLWPRPTSAEALLAEQNIYVLFNDRTLALSPAQQLRLLAGPAQSGLRMYLFGLAAQPLCEALTDAGFRDVLRRMAPAGSLPVAALDGDARPRLATWLKVGLLRREDEVLWPGPRLVLVPGAAEADAFAASGAEIDRYLGIVAGTVPLLRRAYERCAAARRWSWQEVSHSLIAGMLMDLSVGREFDIAGRVRRERGENVLWAFEEISAANAFGVAWQEAPGGDWGVGQLWHAAVPRPRVSLSSGAVELLGRLALGKAAPSASPELLYLRYQKLLRPAAAGVEIAWPVFDPGDAESLSAPLANGGRRLLRESIEVAMERLADHPWWQRMRSDDSYRHALLRLMLEYGADRVFDSGLLAPAGPGLPEAWGRWIWLGRRGDALPRMMGQLAREPVLAEVAP